MPSIPAKVVARFAAGIKKFRPILIDSRDRKANEADTRVIVNEILCDVLGYAKFQEVTGEHLQGGTYCDLAVNLGGKLQFLIEVKAARYELKDQHAQQAIGYAAQRGVRWVVLTNGVSWRIYNVALTSQIESELTDEFDFAELDPKDDDDLAMLWLLSKEGWQKQALQEYHSQSQALSHFSIAAVLVSEPVLKSIRAQLKLVFPFLKFRIEDIERALTADVLRPESLDGDKAKAARKAVTRAAKKLLKVAAEKQPELPADEPAPTEPSPPPPSPSVTIHVGFIVFACELCGKQLRIAETSAGKRARCVCGEILIVPANAG